METAGADCSEGRDAGAWRSSTVAGQAPVSQRGDALRALTEMSLSSDEKETEHWKPELKLNTEETYESYI